MLAFACAAGSAMLGASQFMDMFHLVPPGGEALNEVVSSSDQHGYAMLVLAGLSLLLLVVSLLVEPDGERRGLWQVTVVGIAVAGVLALLLFLTVDLPDVNKIGTVDDPGESFQDAKAEPQAGFWFELVGSLVLAGCGIAMAAPRRQEVQPGDDTASAEGARGAPAESPQASGRTISS
jgi:hypothetical protein